MKKRKWVILIFLSLVLVIPLIIGLTWTSIGISYADGNASSICTGGEFLIGNGSCMNYSIVGIGGDDTNETDRIYAMNESWLLDTNETDRIYAMNESWLLDTNETDRIYAMNASWLLDTWALNYTLYYKRLEIDSNFSNYAINTSTAIQYLLNTTSMWFNKIFVNDWTNLTDHYNDSWSAMTIDTNETDRIYAMNESWLLDTNETDRIYAMNESWLLDTNETDRIYTMNASWLLDTNETDRIYAMNASWLNKTINSTNVNLFDVNTSTSTINLLTLTAPTQDWLFTGSWASLVIQSQSPETATRFQLFSKDGDETDDIYYEIYTDGEPYDIANSQWLRMGWNSDFDFWNLQSGKEGEGELRDMKIQSTDDLVLAPADNLRLDCGGDGYVRSSTIFGDTTSEDANMFIAGSIYQIVRSISSERYKLNITSLTDSSGVLDLTPVSFYSNTTLNVADNPDKKFVGFTAEDMDKFLPDCTIYKWENIYDCINKTDDMGSVQEDCTLVSSTKTDIPEGYSSRCVMAYMFKEVQELRQELDEVKAETCSLKLFSWCLI